MVNVLTSETRGVLLIIGDIVFESDIYDVVEVVGNEDFVGLLESDIYAVVDSVGVFESDIYGVADSVGNGDCV
jgi:hypothetical protein